MSKNARAGWGILLTIVLFWVWYCVAADYSYGAVSGTYSLKFNGDECTLILKADRSFQQELKHAGKVEHTQGTWRRFAEGGLSFSKEFLKISGEEMRPDGHADGEVKKSFGLFMSIALDPNPGGPVFHKEPFR